MSEFDRENETADASEGAYVPAGVLDALDDLDAGRTMSEEDFEDALRF